MSNYNEAALQQTVNDFKKRLKALRTEFKVCTHEFEMIFTKDFENDLKQFLIELTEFRTEVLEDQISFLPLENPHYVCPSKKCFHTLSKSTIDDLCQKNNTMCPFCRCQFTSDTIKPNYTVRRLIATTAFATHGVRTMLHQVHIFFESISEDADEDAADEMLIEKQSDQYNLLSFLKDYKIDPNSVYKLCNNYLIVMKLIGHSIWRGVRGASESLEVLFIVRMDDFCDMPDSLLVDGLNYRVGKIIHRPFIH